MPLFIADHQHNGDHCPARDPQMGQMLLQHLSQENAQAQGVRIHAEAVADGAHRLVIIADAANEETVRKFMGPFAQAGTVKIQLASSCEKVVDRGGC